MWSEKKRDLWLAVSLWALAGCFAFPGMSGERCTEQGLCGSGLACDPESRTCVDEALLLARYCRSVDCGSVQGIECGPCRAPTEACLQNRCVDVCEGGSRCGLVEGAECGGCNASRGEVCEDTRCVRPCVGRCGVVQGVTCGTCGGSTEVCQSNNTCLDVCFGGKCGTVSGKECGGCGGAREVCQSNNTCLDVCSGGKCGTVQGVSCGTCDGTATCEQNQCVVPGYVRIPAGTFTMGSPANESGRGSDEVQHQVTITRDFWLKETEVTQGEWRSLMGSNPSGFSACGDGCPVEQVSWFDAVDYVNALSRSEGLPECYGGSRTSRTFAGLSCRGFRLPTEAEWEYAARAGTTGERYGPLDATAWAWANSGDRTRPVRGKQANAWGLYDMIGNVYEWTHDWYDAYGGAATDPLGPDTGSNRVLRGGSWYFGAAVWRAADRSGYPPGYAYSFLGFRPARSVFP